jgi:hypothetical protein
MQLHDLPPRALEILAKYAAPPRLVAHLTVVHDVAIALIGLSDIHWPQLLYDRDRVLLGAAIHDIGKVVHTDELTGPGNQHEELGPQLLLESGLPETCARLARTHARWKQEAAVQLEDLLVAFADTIWKGKRDEELEQAIIQQIAQQSHEDEWQVYMKFDDLACELARGAHERILWQGAYAL